MTIKKINRLPVFNAPILELTLVSVNYCKLTFLAYKSGHAFLTVPELALSASCQGTTQPCFTLGDRWTARNNIKNNTTALTSSYPYNITTDSSEFFFSKLVTIFTGINANVGHCDLLTVDFSVLFLARICTVSYSVKPIYVRIWISHKSLYGICILLK